MKIQGIALPRANKRLTALYNHALALADNTDVVTDVGADHGYLAAMLAKSNRFAKVIATDISAPSLQKTTQLASQLGLQIETRVGDGLTVAPETTLACICGMGGYEIIKILETKPTTLKFATEKEAQEFCDKNRKIDKLYIYKQKTLTIATSYESKKQQEESLSI